MIRRIPDLSLPPETCRPFVLFSFLFQELDEKNDGYEEICKHTLAILIAQLRRFAVSDFQLFPSFHPSKECALVKRYLDSHYSDDINLEQLASLSHLNKYYLSHEFTRYYGSPDQLSDSPPD